MKSGVAPDAEACEGSTPASTIATIDARQRTGAVTCRTSSSRASTPVVTGFPYIRIDNKTTPHAFPSFVEELERACSK